MIWLLLLVWLFCQAKMILSYLKIPTVPYSEHEATFILKSMIINNKTFKQKQTFHKEEYISISLLQPYIFI